MIGCVEREAPRRHRVLHADLSARAQNQLALGLVRTQRGDFVVVDGDEIPCSFQSVLHRFWNLPQLGFEDRA